jgi:hypothetical protein
MEQTSYVDGVEGLWSAENSDEFYDRWLRKKPIMVCSLFLQDLLERGSGDDLDAFGIMLVVPWVSWFIYCCMC